MALACGDRDECGHGKHCPNGMECRPDDTIGSPTEGHYICTRSCNGNANCPKGMTCTGESCTLGIITCFCRVPTDASVGRGACPLFHPDAAVDNP